VSDRILLHGIEFYGYHGVSEQERIIGHRFSVDVELTIDLRSAGQSDQLECTIDYGEVCRRVVAVGSGEPVRLIEAVAERIANECLSLSDRAEAVRVRVRKLLPPVPSVVAAAEVEIYRTRGDD